MVYCAAFGCSNNSSKGTKVSFFKFPRDKKIKDIWVQKVKRKGWTLSKYSRLCSDHFEDNCYIQSPKFMTSLGLDSMPAKLYLKGDAIPTTFFHQCPEANPVKRGAYEKRRRQKVFVHLLL